MNNLAIKWEDGHLWLLDQTRLPSQVIYLDILDSAQAIEAIQNLRVRGAPAIGVTGAYALYLAATNYLDMPLEAFQKSLDCSASAISSARPTAVNLAWAVGRAKKVVANATTTLEAVDLILAEAKKIEIEDRIGNEKIGHNGAALIPEGSTLLTHCNAGTLATAGYGTALGVIRTAWTLGKLNGVIATETRPLLQGARLTTWELMQDNIPVTLIVDGAVGHLFQKGEITAVVVGADRIAANGDVANKIGTYGIAVLAKAHGVPFYVAAPFSTVDLETLTGSDIPIEERLRDEVASFGGIPSAPEGVPIFNPAFDVTPSCYVSAIITELGVINAPYCEGLRRVAK
jgi:methylthioribose-1-phosphate isomerase